MGGRDVSVDVCSFKGAGGVVSPEVAELLGAAFAASCKQLRYLRSALVLTNGALVLNVSESVGH